LLRLWQTQQEGTSVWRASLESPHTGERRGFISPEDLFAFLQHQLGVAPGVVQEPVSQSDTQQSHAEQRIS
jgi:hypothetical protein